MITAALSLGNVFDRTSTIVKRCPAVSGQKDHLKAMVHVIWLGHHLGLVWPLFAAVWGGLQRSVQFVSKKAWYVHKKISAVKISGGSTTYQKKEKDSHIKHRQTSATEGYFYFCFVCKDNKTMFVRSALFQLTNPTRKHNKKSDNGISSSSARCPSFPYPWSELPESRLPYWEAK